jgi:hypothetical protein
MELLDCRAQKARTKNVSRNSECFSPGPEMKSYGIGNVEGRFLDEIFHNINVSIT